MDTGTNREIASSVVELRRHYRDIISSGYPLNKDDDPVYQKAIEGIKRLGRHVREACEGCQQYTGSDNCIGPHILYPETGDFEMCDMLLHSSGNTGTSDTNCSILVEKRRINDLDKMVNIICDLHGDGLNPLQLRDDICSLCVSCIIMWYTHETLSLRRRSTLGLATLSSVQLTSSDETSVPAQIGEGRSSEESVSRPAPHNVHKRTSIMYDCLAYLFQKIKSLWY